MSEKQLPVGYERARKKFRAKGKAGFLVVHSQDAPVASIKPSDFASVPLPATPIEAEATQR